MTGQTQGTRNPERDARFAALYRDGAYTLEDIALEEALRSGGKPMTRERVRQIVRRAGVTPEESTEAKRRARLVTLTCPNPACAKTFQRNLTKAIEEGARVYCSRACYKAFPPMTGVQKWTDEALLQHLRNLAAKLGHTPTGKEITQHTPPAHTIYYKRWGSLAKACEAAGIKAHYGKGLTARRSVAVRLDDDELLDALGNLALQLGRTPSDREVSTSTVPGLMAVRSRFGKYSDACKLAGLKPNEYSKGNGSTLTDHALLQHLRDLHKQLGRLPTTTDINRAQKRGATYQPYFKRFGGLTKALRLAGLSTVVDG